MLIINGIIHQQSQGLCNQNFSMKILLSGSHPHISSKEKKWKERKWKIKQEEKQKFCDPPLPQSISMVLMLAYSKLRKNYSSAQEQTNHKIGGETFHGFFIVREDTWQESLKDWVLCIRLMLDRAQNTTKAPILTSPPKTTTQEL